MASVTQPMVFSFWGSQVQPRATPSETCLPHRLTITKATLDPEKAAELPPGTRVSVFATQKMRPQRSGALQPVASNRSLVAVLVATHRECVDTRVSFSGSSLISFSVSPQSLSCAVHLAGFFDDSSDTTPEQTDDGSITWAELQELLANARGGSPEDAAEALGQLRDQASQAQEGGDQDRQRQPAMPTISAGSPSGKGKRKTESQPAALDAKKQARLNEIRKEASENEAAFASPISKHAKAHTRKLAGGTQVADVAPGKGRAIKVGSRVSLTLQEQDAKGRKLNVASKVSFVVGLKAVPSGLDRAVVGMREGGRALVSMGASSNDRPLVHWSPGSPLAIEVYVDKVA